MTLSETLAPKSPPIQQDQDGVMRVAGTRVTLETLIYSYENGASAEEIALAYDSIALADVHAVISYYLKNREQVRQYLEECVRGAQKMQQQLPQRESWHVLRQRLLARQQSSGLK